MDLISLFGWSKFENGLMNTRVAYFDHRNLNTKSGPNDHRGNRNFIWSKLYTKLELKKWKFQSKIEISKLSEIKGGAKLSYYPGMENKT